MLLTFVTHPFNNYQKIHLAFKHKLLQLIGLLIGLSLLFSRLQHIYLQSADLKKLLLKEAPRTLLEKAHYTNNTLTHVVNIRTADNTGYYPIQFKGLNNVTPVILNYNLNSQSHQTIPLSIERRLSTILLNKNTTQHRIQTAKLYGDVDDNVYYFMSILVGTPPQRQSVIVDTGSSLVGFRAKNCYHCGIHLDPGFDVNISSTAHWLPCNSEKCFTKRCNIIDNINTCRYTQAYSEGSELAGAYFSDIISIGEVDEHNNPVRFDYFGSHDKETNLFLNQTASGIFGLGPSKQHRTNTILDALFSPYDVKTQTFSLCSGDIGGILSIGGYNSSNHYATNNIPSLSLRLLNTLQRLEFDVNLDNDRLLQFETTPNKLSKNNNFFNSFFNQITHLVTDTPIISTTTITDIDRNDNKTVAAAAAAATDAVLFHTTQMSNNTQHGPKEVPIVWSHFVSDMSYHVQVAKVTVDTQNITTDFNLPSKDIDLNVPCIMDSGSTYSYFPSFARNFFQDIFKASCIGPTKDFCVAASSDYKYVCWRVHTDVSKVDLLPKFLIRFQEGGIVQWNATSYLKYSSYANASCTQIDYKFGNDCVLGLSFMRHKDIIFDRANRALGIVDAHCPSYSVSNRPPLILPINKNKTYEPSEIYPTQKIIAKDTNHSLITPDFELVKDKNFLKTFKTPTHLLAWTQSNKYKTVLGFAVFSIMAGFGTYQVLASRRRNYEPITNAYNNPNTNENILGERDSFSSHFYSPPFNAGFEIDAATSSNSNRAPHHVIGYRSPDAEELLNEHIIEFQAIEAELDELERATTIATSAIE